jgi:hypothetical protein
MHKSMRMAMKALLLTIVFTSAALADCNDIRASCARNFSLDLASCGNGTDAQTQRCQARAHQQLAYCVNSSGCR